MRTVLRLPLCGLLVVALVLGPLAGLLGAAPAAAAADSPRAPHLDVQLTSITPATIPAHGSITLAGTVSNPTEETWHRVNVLPLTSEHPITDPSELADQAESDPSTNIGNRLTAPNTFAQVGNLVPGESIDFRIRVPRRLLQIDGTPGVYWIGVHALGRIDGVRDQQADGRARTFIPLMPGGVGRHGPHASATLVVPVRAPVRHTADGRIRKPEELARSMSPDGRLGRIAAFGSAAGDRSITWLVDPAVLDAASTLAAGNPDLPVGRAPRNGQPGDTPSPTGRAGPAAGLDDQGRADAQTWLGQMTGVLSMQPTLALPYADPDVSRLSRADPQLLHRARVLSDDVLRREQVTARPAVSSPDGWLDPEAAAGLTAGDTVVVSDRTLEDQPHPSVTSLPTGQRVVYADAAASRGGPRPAPRYAALTLRQDVLAQAALRALAGNHHRLVVQLPPGWDPGTQWQEAGFFTGLDQPWLDLRPLPQPHTVQRQRLDYPRRAHRNEVPRRNVALAERLFASGRTLAGLLDTDNGSGGSDQPSDDSTNGAGAGAEAGSGGAAPADLSAAIQSRLTGAALTTVSYHARQRPRLSRAVVAGLEGTVIGLLDQVELTGTEFVTLSSDSGTLTLALVNGLDQPIQVGVHATTDSSGVSIEDLEPVQMAPGQRASIRLTAHAETIGVHEVTVVPVTDKGRRLGDTFTFSLRTSQVGRWFWAILIAVGALLVLLILRRVVVRVRSHRWRT